MGESEFGIVGMVRRLLWIVLRCELGRRRGSWRGRGVGLACLRRYSWVLSSQSLSVSSLLYSCLVEGVEL